MAHRQRSGRAKVLRQHVDHGVAELVADPGRARAWTLLLDGTPQSYVDLDDPEYLDFEYVRRLGHVVDLAAPPGRPLRVLHLGAGGLTLARYVAATRPRSSQLVAEIDGALVELIRRALPAGLPGHAGRRPARSGQAGPAEPWQAGPAEPWQAGQAEPRQTGPAEPRQAEAGLSPAPAASGQAAPGPSGVRQQGPRRLRSRQAGRLRIRVGDARQILEEVSAGSFDLVINDVFAGGRTPAHLTSVEFAAAAGRALRDGGMLGVNAADGGALAHARAQAATVRSVLPDVCVIADPAVLRGRRFGNLVLAASRATLPVAALTRLAAADPFPGRVLHGADLMKFIAGARPVTDAAAQPSP